MTIQEAVTKATEGGYHIHAADGMDSDYAGANSEYWCGREKIMRPP